MQQDQPTIALPVRDPSNPYDAYAKWTDKVAMYPKTAQSFYLALGIADEAGELLLSGNEKEARAEAGDVLWYCARYAVHVLQIPFSDIIDAVWKLNQTIPAGAAIGVICGVEKKRLRDGESWSAEKLLEKHGAAYAALVQVVHWVVSIFPQHNSMHALVQELLKENMAKLEARLSASVIQGDGDNR